MLQKILLSFVIAIVVSEAAHYDPNWTSIDKRPLPSWFDESKIGIFIVWGVFSVPSFGSEWFWWQWMGSHDKNYVDFMNKNYHKDFKYEEFAPNFTAEFYNPSHWADIIEASGAKYVVLTSKHHDGYTLWPSKYSPKWNALEVGPKRDLLGDLAKAVRAKKDLRFGVYHSWFEWFNHEYLEDKKNKFQTQKFVNDKTYPELIELVEKYKPEVIWSDGDWEAPDTYWKSAEFLAWLYNESPVKDTVVVNDRWGIGASCHHGGYYSCADRFNPGKLQAHKWENAMTIDKVSWGFRREALLTDYMTIHELISTVAGTVSCGGNILINIGPTHDGRIVPIFEERLRQLGQWLSVNGEAIYKSIPWKHQNDTVTKGIWYTEQSKNIYAIVLNWPHDHHLVLGSVDHQSVKSVHMLGVKEELKHSASGSGTSVTFPEIDPESNLQWAWVLKITI